MIIINEIIHKYKSDFELNIRNLNIESNQILGLVGENGAGKTTLMSILSGYLKANKSYNVNMDKNKSNILFIPSDIELYDFITVEEFIGLVSRYSEEPVDTSAILETLELTDKGQCSIDELSLGMKKKLTLLPLFIRKYDILILDEHILETLVDLCDSFALISDGRLEKQFLNTGDIRVVEGEIFEKGN